MLSSPFPHLLRFRALLYWHLALSAVGLLIYSAFLNAWAGVGFLTGVVLVLAVGKCGFYCWSLYRSIVNAAQTNTYFYQFLLALGGLIMTAIFSFAVDFFCLYTFNPKSLEGIDPKAEVWLHLFDCWYFSVLNFSFFGVAEILPRSYPTKFLLTLEALISFLTVMFILSDFISLRDSIHARRAGAPPPQPRKG